MPLRSKPVQLEITYRRLGRGGKRPGAGRPRTQRSRVAHRSRPRLASRYPVHVTVKLRRGVVGSLRTKDCYRIIRRAFARGCLRENFRITDWSLMRDHIHLIAEAKNAECLGRGIQGFKVRVAKGLNAKLGRKGAVFAGRYHARILKTPREVRNALNYVLNNARRHGYKIPTSRPDPFCSWSDFDGWRAKLNIRQVPGDGSPVAKSGTWLRHTGWRRCGLIRVNEVPGQRPKATRAA